MKFVKGISLFFIYPAVMFGLGYFAGLTTLDFFYPGSYEEEGITQPTEYNDSLFEEEPAVDDAKQQFLRGDNQTSATESGDAFTDASVIKETLNADTEYVLWEKDLLKNTIVETVGRIPVEFIGLNREQLLLALEEYEMFPPLSELERGFMGVEVISFAPEKLVVQSNYQYVQPSESFYLAVRDNEVTVLLQDKETVFINTGILLSDLPDEIQMKIMQLYWIENEAALYDFLESYSS